MHAFRHLNTITFLILLAGITVAAGLLFAPFVGSLFIAMVLAIIFFRPYERLVRLMRGRRGVAALIMSMAVAITIIAPTVIAGVAVAGEVTDVLSEVTVTKESVIAVGDYVGPIARIIPGVDREIMVPQNLLQNVAQKVGSLAMLALQKTYTGAIDGVIGTFVVFFALYFFFVDGKRFVDRIMFLSPLPDHHDRMLIHRFVSMTRATIKGTLVIGVIQGTIGAATLLLAGVSSVLVWWIVLIFFAIVPMIGAGIVGFPMAAYYFMIGDAHTGTIIAIGFAFLSIFDNYLRPVLVGRDVQMHTLLVFFATFGGVIAFGVAGFVIGPIVMALCVALWEIYAEEFGTQLTAYNDQKDAL